jgi:hypothetical protein
MTKYKKRPVVIEATQWFHNGDHPEDETHEIAYGDGPPRLSEGKVVRYFASLKIPGDRVCPICGNTMKTHGELPNARNGTDEIICPGDYIVTDSEGRRYKMPAQQFELMYEPYST